MKSSPAQIYYMMISLLLSFMLSSCSLDSENNPVQITSKPNNPSPAVNSTNQGRTIILSWDATNATSFDVYLDTQNPPQSLYAANITTKSVEALLLNANTTYYWKVVSKLDTGNLESDVWNFTTGSSIVSTEAGNILIRKSISTEKPCYVNMIFQVVGYDGLSTTTLSKDDFQLFDDDSPVSASESDLVINKKTDVFDTLHVVVMLDNSTSLTANIEQIRNAASELVYNLANATIDGVKLNVQVAIYTFSEKVVRLTDYITDKDRLYGVVYDNYKLGQATTNLYGAVITGASRWTDVMTSDKIRQGVMIVFTDGSDTQGSSTFGDALTAVTDKRVFTVGLGNEIDSYILGRLGTAGSFAISDVSQLQSKFQAVQKEILEYINSFYLLKYKSPKRGGFDHKLRLNIKNNQNTGTGSYIEGYYNSSGFSSN